MSAASAKLRFVFLVVALACVVSAATAGTAMAKLVVSDTVSFKAVFSASSGTYRATKCVVKSDGETTTFPCSLTGTALGVGTPLVEVTSLWASADGEGFFPVIPAPRVASKPPVETYAGKGPCEEREESDLPGNKETVQYPCVVSFRLAFNLKTSVVAGSYKVSEESGQP